VDDKKKGMSGSSLTVLCLILVSSAPKKGSWKEMKAMNISAEKI
jgi:hypothetical protein